MDDFIESIKQKLEKYGFIDIEYISHQINATLPPYSNIRPFEKRYIRYFGITDIGPINSPYSKRQFISIQCEKEEEIFNAKISIIEEIK